MYKQTFLKKLRESRTTRIISAFLVLNLLVEIVSPTVAMALTAGASAPEFSSFEPVATTDMVNDFSGDFTYNLPVLKVPGPDGGGYSMSLAYHSGVSSEEEASWVGFGWTLNPGAINRNKRGYADEFAGVDVENYNKAKANWTHSSKFDCNIELNSSDATGSEKVGKGFLESLQKVKKNLGLTGMGTNESSNKSNDPADISVSISHTIRYNNYSGFSIANGVGVNLFGIASVDMNRSGGQNTFGFSVNPRMIMKAMGKKHAVTTKNTEKKVWKDTKDEKAIRRAKLKQDRKDSRTSRRTGSILAHYSFNSYEAPALGYSIAHSEGASWNFSGSVQFNPTGPFGYQVGIAGNTNVSATEGKQIDHAYGYMNSDQANLGGAANEVYDFQLEKESTFNKHDKNLGIPFNNADLFSASGNGVVGGFKIIHDNIGSYYPNTLSSETKIRQLGVEIGIGTTNTMGLDFGIGKQKTEVHGKWPKMPGMTDKLFSSGTNKPTMRFTNDLGGEVNYSDDYNDLLFAKIHSDKQLDLDSDFDLALDQTKSHNSSYIDYTQANNTNNPSINALYITNKDGGKSNYTLPIYTKNEAELTTTVPFHDGTDIIDNELDFDTPLNNTTAIGHKISEQYPSSYLLTSNTTFNYIDADLIAGPSMGDFGGWTRFDYKQAYGGLANNWYRYRSPYAGLNYNRGRLLDPEDGTGSMSSGDKEVYYLKCIETKSHIAFFVTNKMTAATFSVNFPQGQYPYLYSGGLPITTVTTNVSGSGDIRYDGVDAAPINITTGKDEAANNLNAKGTHDLEKLERIVLFAKSDLSTPLTTTFFEYDYSLCQGIPNSLAPANAVSKDKGKLTLKKVWTESGGTLRSQIAPYEFEYEYFLQYSPTIIAKYPWTKTEFKDVYTTNDANQNPAYKSSHLDAWGNYQEEGAKRFENMQTWLSQKAPSSTFDPAAWQLKRIKLPSGGEIHINYEQKDYLNVQDLRPTAMVSLLPDENKDGYKSDESVFCINTDDLAVGTSISTYTSVLYDHFINQNNKLYFKMLYAFTDDGEPQLNTENRRFEYISGYTNVNKISVTAGGTKILMHLGDLRDNCLQNGDGKKDKTLPRYVCYQELLGNGGTNLGLNSAYYKGYDYSPAAYSSNPISNTDMSGKAFIQALPMTVMMFTDWISGKVHNVRKKNACKSIKFDLSYFKLPVFNAKKGGGIRVKRLLTYDPGISGENGDAMLYGSEYSYKNEDGTSSGVATNEPSSIREENVLVGLMERKKQKWLNKIMNGKDTKHFEGPVGENIMPGAEVGHSRIVIKNIHSGKSTPGYAVNSYHTAKENPVSVDFSRISKDNKTYKKFNLSLPLGPVNLEMHRAWVTQGYIFKLNDLHGKIAGKATYAGNYEPANFSETAFTSKTTYNYSQLGEKIQSVLFDNGTKEFKRDFLNPGMEEDYTMFTSYVRDKTCNFTVEVDFNLTLPIVPSLGQKTGFSYTDSRLCQHVTSKVVRQVTYLMSTTNVTDGVAQTTENLAFDRYTGDPVLTRTFDGYMAPNNAIYTQGDGATKHSGYYYALNIPAAWMYSSFRPKTVSATNTNQLTLMAGNVVTYGSNELYTAFSNTATTAWSPYTNSLTNVVNASATTYTNNWFDASAVSEHSISASVPSASITANSFLYPERSFSYKDLVNDANQTNGKIYKGGVASNPLSFFDWITYTPNSAVASDWYSDSKITKYSPNGYPLEEQDVLAIKSSARFGYANTLPVLVAQNAAYNDTRFTDFEYGMGLNSNVKSNTAHSGRASYLLSGDPTYTVAANYPVHTHKGLSLKVWLKSSLSTNVNDVNYGLKNSNPQFKAKMGGKEFEFKRIAQTGEWTLYSADIKDFQGLTSGIYTIQLNYNYVLPNELVYIDDVRLQPMDASMNCSVYYADNKLAAQFDDQHFGVFYEYNNNGQLVRKSIETERGKKVLQEQQYNTPLKIN